jgi:hypothetical protein
MDGTVINFTSEEIRIRFLEGVAGYLRRSVTNSKLGYCRKHRAVHTGKICYLIIIDLVLHRLTGSPEALEEARAVARRVAAMLGTDPRSGARVFLPGALDHRNAANHAIDSGAATDCLASLVLEGGAALEVDERARLTAAAEACAASYLKDAARVKGIPAQRLWAGTGLASAYALTGTAAFRDAALQSIELLLEDSGEDGSIPYFPGAVAAGEHPGQADITAYYHSRCIGFALYILERLGEKPWPKLSAFLETCLDFLLGLYGGDGLKRLQNEAKQWYWESAYEVASHSFDVHALAMGARLLGRGDLLAHAALSFQQLDRHRLEDGGIHSHRGGGLNFQCRLFWNAHAAWTARVIEDLPLREPPFRNTPRGLEVFQEGGLVKVAEEGYAAILRGVKQPMNIAFGSEVGGGCLLYFGTADRRFEDGLRIGKWAQCVPGSFLVEPAGGPGRCRLARAFLKENKSDIRFRLYIAWMEFIGGHPVFAVLYPFRHVLAKWLSEMRGGYASHWDCRARISRERNTVFVEGAPARRDGTRLEGAREEREYLFEKDRILVTNRLFLAGRIRRLRYGLSPCFRNLRLAPEDLVIRISHGRAVIRPEAPPLRIEAEYELPAQPRAGTNS